MGFYNEGGSGAAAIGRLVKTTYLTTGTGATFTPQPETTQMIVTVVGGGGGGGGIASTQSTTQAYGGCGGGGGYAVKRFADMSDTFTYTIGSGGSGGAAGANNGSTGGTSTFSGATSGTVTANGGEGGAGVTTAAISGGYGGTGGSSSGGDINLDGGDATGTIVRNSEQYAVPSSGSSPFFGGRQSSYNAGDGDTADSPADSHGRPGENYGCGGCGARKLSVGASGTNYAGGDGAHGIIVVEEYS